MIEIVDEDALRPYHTATSHSNSYPARPALGGGVTADDAARIGAQFGWQPYPSVWYDEGTGTQEAKPHAHDSARASSASALAQAIQSPFSAARHLESST